MSYTYFSKEDGEKLFEEFGGTATNTGSVEAQIALFTRRIEHLNEHLKQFKKDHTTRRSLLRLVGKRRKLQAYLKRKDIVKYRLLIAKLGLRR